MDQAQQTILNALPALIVGFLTVMGAAAVAMIRIWGQVQVARGETNKVKESLEQEKLKTAENKEKLAQAELNLRTQQVSHKTELEAIKLSSERDAAQNKNAMEALGIEFAKKLQDQHQQLLDDLHRQTIAFTESISLLKGEKNQLERTVVVLGDRLEAVGNQKYEAIQQANSIQAELEAVHSSEMASTQALNKANELLQNYERRIAEDKQTIVALQDQVNLQAVKIGKLETELDEFRRTAEQRHADANTITARNMRYAAYLMQYKIVLQAITNAIPLRSMPPDVIKEFAGHSIDVPHLLNLHFDNDDMPNVQPQPDPLTVDLKSTQEVSIVKSGDVLKADEIP